MTAYLEYLLRHGIQSERYYLGDASRFMRYLLANASQADIEAFIAHSASSPSYEKRLRKTLKKFFAYANDQLGLEVRH